MDATSSSRSLPGLLLVGLVVFARWRALRDAVDLDPSALLVREPRVLITHREARNAAILEGHDGQRIATVLSLFGLVARFATTLTDPRALESLFGLVLAALSPTPARASVAR